ncbi:MAG: hypothetical protein M1833_006886 [Piccolia ochrophora]|nr:MAG: hypothetical protein M1833_006886 [Piccolia ochrophora]
MPHSAEPPSPTLTPDLDILGDQVTIHPGGYVEPSSLQDESQERNLVEHMARFRDSPLEFLREVSLHLSGSGWRAYDDVIGQPIYYSGFTEHVKAEVMSTPMLRNVISQLAEKRLAVEEQQGLLLSSDAQSTSKRSQRQNAIETSLQEVAEKMTDEMICKFESKRFIRGAYYVCTQLLTRAYHQGIHCSAQEVLRLRSVAEEASKKKQSIIFLPCHRSHVDYVSLQLICYRLGLALPTVIAGDNLNFPLVGQFLQNAGAMWIRRSFGDDVLYTTLVQSYIDTLLHNGYNFECFIEGGRSRVGKLLPPKFGILRFIVDTIMSGRVEDAIICPVSTQYDKVIETEGYVNELLGIPKKKENLVDFLSASSVLSLKLGRVDVRFHEPWSLKGFVQQQQTRMTSVPQRLNDTEGTIPDVRTRILRTLGYKVLSDINAVSVVMPTALIGTVLLTLRGRGVGKEELVRRVDWLSDRVRAKGGRVAHFAGLPTSVVVERGLEVLGPGLVGLIEGLGEETYYAVDRFQLSFYRNMTIHLFISEALVSAGMYTRVKQGGGPDNQRISYRPLYDQVSFLSQLFRGEFIYPTEGLIVNLDKTLTGLENDNVIKMIRGSGHSQSESPSEIVSVELSAAERLCGRENFDFYCFLIWPFIEASWLGAVSLLGLTPPLGIDDEIWLDQKQMQEKAQLLGKTLYHQGDLSYFEAVNKEALKNALERFEDEGIVLVARSRRARSATVMKLAPEWTPERDKATGAILPKGRLWDFTELIAQSRREGKNRRDGATVSTRVLKLTDKIGSELFEKALSSPDTAISSTPMQPPLRIAILECDTPLDGTRAKYGGYGGVFTALLRAGADALNEPDVISSDKGLEISKWDVVNERQYPELNDIDGILITGSRFSAFEDTPWIVQLVEFVSSVLAQHRVRVIGVCFGHQIVGRALGATVKRSKVGWEVSVLPVTLTSAGKELFHKPNLSLHQMHRDIVLAYPSGVTDLGHSARCATQGMHAPRRLITVQGHPEFNEGIVRELLESRHRQGIFDDETYEDAIKRVGNQQDGVAVAAGFLRFLMEE